MFHTQNPRIDINTFRMFYEHIKVYKVKKTTASSIGYASIATKPTYEQLQERLKSQEERIKQLEESTKSQAKPQPNKSSYCWTHGACNHNGHNCRDPLPGHIADASFRQRKGGSNKGCSKKNNN